MDNQDIIDAVEKAELCCPEQVCDMLIATSERGEDWRQELQIAIARDPAERKRLGIED